ncbi:hypothetical protein Trco_006216 [Trichoderma cornu-damae]|uniref:Uncharacterized protein n=1 Tax=Trichoderma cornu-damae TaxID=654480 RepID=A0A9P8TUT5_9HYPO|nr:hypothetical protein Trco_006216 [Trichoderma cornu-damae]
MLLEAIVSAKAFGENENGQSDMLRNVLQEEAGWDVMAEKTGDIGEAFEPSCTASATSTLGISRKA